MQEDTMTTRDNSQRMQSNILDLIMNLRVDLARVEERQSAQSEATTAALRAQGEATAAALKTQGEATTMALKAQEKILQDNTQLLKQLNEKFESWQNRTTLVEGQVNDLADQVESIRNDVDCHFKDHKEKEKENMAEESKKKFWIFQQKITATQAIIMLVLTVIFGILSNVVGAALMAALGLK